MTREKLPEKSSKAPHDPKGNFKVLSGNTSTRAIRAAILELAFQQIQGDPAAYSYLIIKDSRISPGRIQEEIAHSKRVIKDHVLARMIICTVDGKKIHAFGRQFDAAEEKLILARIPSNDRRAIRPDSRFIIIKVLLHHWLTNGSPVTTKWISEVSGFAYPAVAGVLKSLGSLIERGSDRRVRFQMFPRDEFDRMTTNSETARSTVRFKVKEVGPVSDDIYLKRLNSIYKPTMAVGGVIGARYYFPDLDLIGVPRIDLSIHSPSEKMNLGFIKKLDPALEIVSDPREHASIVVHSVQHAESLFSVRPMNLAYADPVECLLDLYESKLVAQANQFLDHLLKNRPIPL